MSDFILEVDRLRHENEPLKQVVAELLAVLRDWAQQNITRVSAAQQEFDAHKLN